MRKFILFICVLLFCLSLSGCGKSLDERVAQKKESVEVGTQINLVDLFECEEGVSVGVKNANSFDANKVGSYSIDLTIMDGKEEVDKSFIVKVTDGVAPEITAEEKVVLYEKDSFDPNTYASATDNSQENIALEVIENNVNMKKAGEYAIKYQAKDSSGNTSTKDMKVVVKKVYSFSERKKLVKKIIEDGKYNSLKMGSNNDSKDLWVEFKKSNFSTVTKGLSFHYISPYLNLEQEKKKLKPILYVNVAEVNENNFLVPKSIYISSDKGEIGTDNGNLLDTRYINAYIGGFYSYLSYYDSKEKNLDKLIDILSGDYLKFKVYTDKKNFSYKCKKKEINMMKELMGFYNDLKAYL